jgi:hypothetical protein
MKDVSKHVSTQPSLAPRFLGALLAAPFVLRYTPAYAGPSAPTKRFTILHTNDPHGHLMPFSYADKTAPGDDVSYMPKHVQIGGSPAAQLWSGTSTERKERARVRPRGFDGRLRVLARIPG